MKLTPLAKAFIALVIVAVVGFVLWSKFGGEAKQWAADSGPNASGAPSGSAAGPAGLSKDDFKNLGPAKDADRKAPVNGIAPGHDREGQARSAAGRRDQHVGRPLSRDRLQRRPRPERGGLHLQKEVRHGREVRPPRGPRGQAGGLPQRAHRHHVGHGRQLGARGVDPRRAEPEGEVDRHAGLVPRRRRHRLARVDQDRSRS